jgi:hypothetical protein
MFQMWQKVWQHRVGDPDAIHPCHIADGSINRAQYLDVDFVLQIVVYFNHAYSSAGS